MGMSAAVGLDFVFPTICKTFSTLEPQPRPQTAFMPYLLPAFSWGSGYHHRPPQSHPQDVVDPGLASFA